MIEVTLQCGIRVIVILTSLKAVEEVSGAVILVFDDGERSRIKETYAEILLKVKKAFPYG